MSQELRIKLGHHFTYNLHTKLKQDVDLEFRQKAKQMLTSPEILVVMLFVLLIVLPWDNVIAIGIVDSARIIGIARVSGFMGRSGLACTLTPTPVSADVIPSTRRSASHYSLLTDRQQNY